ncbi:SDR family NAD(P)-dependent oxidoreductase [Sphingomonas sp. SRS2]|uniref:SDR family NAD(P)-dependent oxidoreductase n=1 Tax=Sphingomonas sp. SRS2 TaxID=133190 RepID=UPI0006184147|nr:SDR family oxidoreductase [Sphingomonas sp. SRS2]KKC23959.1 short-chain dehydrogenase [Sphingomonas sp. SRS2]
MGQLDGKVVVITGGGKGLGRGMSRVFARDGAHVVIAELDGIAAEETARAIEAETGVACLAYPCDITHRDQAIGAIEKAVGHFGGLDVVINNASMLSPNILLEQKTDAMLHGSLQVALWSTWWTMQAALPHLRARGGGSIINFFSIDAQVGSWYHSDYNVAKSAVLGLTRTAAVEWGRFNVRVNAIAPTGLGTVMEKLVEDDPSFFDMVAAINPLGRVGDPERDVAPVAVFLASDAARFMTGELLHVDGGQHVPGFNNKPPDWATMDENP